MKAGIIGATGYAGLELVRLLISHPNVTLSAMSSVSFEGKQISEVYGNLYTICDHLLCNDETVMDTCDVIFASLPHGLSESYAKKCFEKEKIFIDLGADFRLENEEDYKEWYKGEYKEKELHKEAVYALPELFLEQIKESKIIGNPGCYPTSIALGLAPALIHKLVNVHTIVIDSKSGVTGAGRGLTQNTHYPDCNEAFAPYKVCEHRHTPEIEQTLSKLCGEQVFVTFVPHLLPVNRGIESTIYVNCNDSVEFDEIYEAYQEFYKNKQFVRVLKKGDIANIKNIKYSNYCDISLHFDKRTKRLVIVSCIDNMVKGAAGQAVQNMNILLGLNEDAGLKMIPPAF